MTSDGNCWFSSPPIVTSDFGGGRRTEDEQYPNSARHENLSATNSSQRGKNISNIESSHELRETRTKKQQVLQEAMMTTRTRPVYVSQVN
jgi:hypothetical protein